MSARLPGVSEPTFSALAVADVEEFLRRISPVTPTSRQEWQMSINRRTILSNDQAAEIIAAEKQLTVEIPKGKITRVVPA